MIKPATMKRAKIMSIASNQPSTPARAAAKLSEAPSAMVAPQRKPEALMFRGARRV